MNSQQKKDGEKRHQYNQSDKFVSVKVIENMITPKKYEEEYQYAGKKYEQGLKTQKKIEKKEQERDVQSQKKIEIKKGFIFEDSDTEECNQIEQKTETQKAGFKNRNSIIFQQIDFSDSDDEEQEIDSFDKMELFGENQEKKISQEDKNSKKNQSSQPNSKKAQKQEILNYSQPQANSREQQKRFLTPQMHLPPQIFVRMQMWRQKSFFIGNYYQICLQSNHRMILTAKETYSGFILSRSAQVFQEHSPQYLGKAKFDFARTHMDFFMPGYNPSKASELNVQPRELVISLDVVKQSMMEDVRPRQFQVYVLKEGMSYYRDLVGVIKGQQLSLGQLYRKNPKNQDKITLFKTRKSKWDEEKRIHYLNMRGRASLASIKNFILEDAISGADAVLLGKIEDDIFNIDIFSPLNTISATAIALSNFFYKN